MGAKAKKRSERARKYERLAAYMELSEGMVRAIIRGDRVPSYTNGKAIDFIFGGGIDLWCQSGNGAIKAKLFDDGEV